MACRVSCIPANRASTELSASLAGDRGVTQAVSPVRRQTVQQLQKNSVCPAETDNVVPVAFRQLYVR